MNMQRIVGSPDGKHFKNVSIYHIPLLTKTLFTWSGGPQSSGVGFFCFHALADTKQKKPTPLDRGPPLHVNRVLVVQNSVVVVQNSGKGKTKKRAARAICFFAN